MNVKLELRGGEFYRGGQKVPTMIGDTEQIALLKKIERNRERCEKDGIGCDFTASNIEFDAEISFECICGAQINDTRRVYRADYADDETAASEWEFQQVTCRKCRTTYEIEDDRAKIVE